MPQSIKAEKSNPGLAPVGVKPSVKQANASHPATRCPVPLASSGLLTHSGRVVPKPDKLNL